MPAIATRHDVCPGLAAEVAVLLGVELPVDEVAVNPRGVGNRVLEGERLDALGAAGGEKVKKPEIPIAAGDHRPDAGLLDRFLWKRRYMVADEHRLVVMLRYPLPVTLDDRRLRLKYD